MSKGWLYKSRLVIFVLYKIGYGSQPQHFITMMRLFLLLEVFYNCSPK